MSNIINEDDKIITDRILNALSSNNIQNYLINTVITTSDESFYVLKNNVLSRNKYTVKSTVTIYNDFDDENNKYRGSFSFTADLNMDEEELSSRALNAYNSAGAVKNPYYPLPLGDSMFLENSKSNSYEIPMNLDSSRHIADIILGCEYTSSVINSTEVFVTTKYNHTIKSNGENVKYSTSTYEGEYVAQLLQVSNLFMTDLLLYHILILLTILNSTKLFLLVTVFTICLTATYQDQMHL